MTGVLAPTLHALEQGVLDRAKARVIADHCRPLTPDHTQHLQDLVLPDAGALTTTELREAAGQAVIIVDPDGAEHRHQEAAARRELQLQPQPDGMATLKAHLPADGAVKIFQVSDLLATGTAGTPGDTRGIGARRVDALVDIADHLLTHGFVDLTDYLGAELPDHGTPNPRTRNTSSSSTNGDGTNGSADAAEATGTTDTPSTPEAAAPEAGDADTPTATTPDADTASADATTTPTDDTSGDGDDADIGAATTGPAESAATTNTAVPADTDTDSPEDTFAHEAAAETAADADVPADTDTDGPDDAFTREAAAPEFLTDTDAVVTSTAGSAETGTAAAATGPATKRRGGNRVFTRQGRRPHLSVTIGLSTLAGLDNLPGSLAGYGAIPAGLARSIAASAATINALVTDPDTGKVTAAGALTYRPTQELRDQIAALCNVCQFPSCRQPVWRCDMDHREEFNHQHPDHGGKTTPENTGPFCRRHHLIKHHSEWRIRIDPNRYVLEFTSPTGHTYQKQGRQAAVPGLWVGTAGTAIAERVDMIASPPSTLIRRADDQPAPTSHIEDLLAAILVRHHLNTKTIEIDYDPETAWETVDLGDPPPF
jgi:hypothetical protein